LGGGEVDGFRAISATPSASSDHGRRAYAIGQIGLSWLKVFLECDARYKQFLKKPSDASEWQTTVQ
jgi:hypothetical protein